MTKRDQIRFVSDLQGNLRADIAKAIHTGDIPRSWDGIELREYIADKAQRSRARRVLVGQRARAYRNHVRITASL